MITLNGNELTNKNIEKMLGLCNAKVTVGMPCKIKEQLALLNDCRTTSNAPSNLGILDGSGIVGILLR